MRIKDYFLEPVPQENISNSSGNNKIIANTKEKDSIHLRNVDIIHKTAFLMGKIEANEILVTRNIFTNHYEKKGTGFHVKMPLVKEAYIIDISDLILDIDNPETNDGRYKQSIGAGDDISLSLKVTIKIADEPQYLSQLIKQQKSYKSAIRKVSERLMRLQINEKFLITNLSDEKVLEKISNTNSKGHYFNFERDLDLNNKIHQEMLDISADFLKNYGLIISDITFTDIDPPERLKKLISDRIEELNTLKMRKQKADTEKYVAEKEATALKSREQAKIEMLKKTKEDLLLSEAQMAEILNRQSMPAGSVFISSNQNDNLVNYMAANAAYDQVKNRPKENGGRSL